MTQFWQHYLYPFLNSTFLVGAVTVIAGLVALYVYHASKIDAKRTAARILLLELRVAKRQLKEIRRNYLQSKDVSNLLNFGERLRVLPIDSWDTYRHLFIGEFSDELWNEVSDFYQNAHFLDEALARIDGAFGKNETVLRGNLYRVLAKYSDDATQRLKPNPTNNSTIDTSNTEIRKKLADDVDVFTDTLLNTYFYTPKKPFQDATFFLQLLTDQSSTINTIESVLKRFAHRKQPLIKRIARPKV